MSTPIPYCIQESSKTTDIGNRGKAHSGQQPDVERKTKMVSARERLSAAVKAFLASASSQKKARADVSAQSNKESTSESIKQSSNTIPDAHLSRTHPSSTQRVPMTEISTTESTKTEQKHPLLVSALTSTSTVFNNKMSSAAGAHVKSTNTGKMTEETQSSLREQQTENPLQSSKLQLPNVTARARGEGHESVAYNQTKPVEKSDKFKTCQVPSPRASSTEKGHPKLQPKSTEQGAILYCSLTPTSAVDEVMKNTASPETQCEPTSLKGKPLDNVQPQNVSHQLVTQTTSSETVKNQKGRSSISVTTSSAASTSNIEPKKIPSSAIPVVSDSINKCSSSSSSSNHKGPVMTLYIKKTSSGQLILTQTVPNSDKCSTGFNKAQPFVKISTGGGMTPQGLTRALEAKSSPQGEEVPSEKISSSASRCSSSDKQVQNQISAPGTSMIMSTPKIIRCREKATTDTSVASPKTYQSLQVSRSIITSPIRSNSPKTHTFSRGTSSPGINMINKTSPGTPGKNSLSWSPVSGPNPATGHGNAKTVPLFVGSPIPLVLSSPGQPMQKIVGLPSKSHWKSVALQQNQIDACKIWSRQSRHYFTQEDPKISDIEILRRQAFHWTKMSLQEKMPYIQQAQRIQNQKMQQNQNAQITRAGYIPSETLYVSGGGMRNETRRNTPVIGMSQMIGPRLPKPSISVPNVTICPGVYPMSPNVKKSPAGTTNASFHLRNVVASGSDLKRITMRWKPIPSTQMAQNQMIQILSPQPANLISIPDFHPTPTVPALRNGNPTFAKMIRCATYVADHPNRFISDRFMRKAMSEDVYDMDDLLEDAERGIHWRGRGPDVVPNWLVNYLVEYDVRRQRIRRENRKDPSHAAKRKSQSADSTDRQPTDRPTSIPQDILHEKASSTKKCDNGQIDRKPTRRETSEQHKASMDEIAPDETGGVQSGNMVKSGGECRAGLPEDVVCTLNTERDGRRCSVSDKKQRTKESSVDGVSSCNESATENQGTLRAGQRNHDNQVEGFVDYRNDAERFVVLTKEYNQTRQSANKGGNPVPSTATSTLQNCIPEVSKATVTDQHGQELVREFRVCTSPNKSTKDNQLHPAYSEDLTDLGNIDLIPEKVLWNLCVGLFPNSRRVKLWRDNNDDLEKFFEELSSAVPTKDTPLNKGSEKELNGGDKNTRNGKPDEEIASFETVTKNNHNVTRDVVTSAENANANSESPTDSQHYSFQNASDLIQTRGDIEKAYQELVHTDYREVGREEPNENEVAAETRHEQVKLKQHSFIRGDTECCNSSTKTDLRNEQERVKSVEIEAEHNREENPKTNEDIKVESPPDASITSKECPDKELLSVRENIGNHGTEEEWELIDWSASETTTPDTPQSGSNDPPQEKETPQETKAGFKKRKPINFWAMIMNQEPPQNTNSVESNDTKCKEENDSTNMDDGIMRKVSTTGSNEAVTKASSLISNPGDCRYYPNVIKTIILRTPGISYLDYEDIPSCSNDFTFGRPIHMENDERCQSKTKISKQWKLRLAALPRKKNKSFRRKSSVKGDQSPSKLVAKSEATASASAIANQQDRDETIAIPISTNAIATENAQSFAKDLGQRESTYAFDVQSTSPPQSKSTCLGNPTLEVSPNEKRAEVDLEIPDAVKENESEEFEFPLNSNTKSKNNTKNKVKCDISTPKQNASAKSVQLRHDKECHQTKHDHLQNVTPISTGKVVEKGDGLSLQITESSTHAASIQRMPVDKETTSVSRSATTSANKDTLSCTPDEKACLMEAGDIVKTAKCAQSPEKQNDESRTSRKKKPDPKRRRCSSGRGRETSDLSPAAELSISDSGKEGSSFDQNTKTRNNLARKTEKEEDISCVVLTALKTKEVKRRCSSGRGRKINVCSDLSPAAELSISDSGKEGSSFEQNTKTGNSLARKTEKEEDICVVLPDLQTKEVKQLDKRISDQAAKTGVFGRLKTTSDTGGLSTTCQSRIKNAQEGDMSPGLTRQISCAEAQTIQREDKLNHGQSSVLLGFYEKESMKNVSEHEREETITDQFPSDCSKISGENASEHRDRILSNRSCCSTDSCCTDGLAQVEEKIEFIEGRSANSQIMNMADGLSSDGSKSNTAIKKNDSERRKQSSGDEERVRVLSSPNKKTQSSARRRSSGIRTSYTTRSATQRTRRK